MTNDRKNQLQQTESEREGTQEGEHQEQFNELSELSLEERIAVADQIGVPVTNAVDAVALGTARSGDDAAEVPEERIEGNTENDTER